MSDAASSNRLIRLDPASGVFKGRLGSSGIVEKVPVRLKDNDTFQTVRSSLLISELFRANAQWRNTGRVQGRRIPYLRPQRHSRVGMSDDLARLSQFPHPRAFSPDCDNMMVQV